MDDRGRDHQARLEAVRLLALDPTMKTHLAVAQIPSVHERTSRSGGRGWWKMLLLVTTTGIRWRWHRLLRHVSESETG